MLDNPAWLFALATIIACFGIVVVFKGLMERTVNIIGTDNETDILQKETTRFFIKVAVIEIVPIVLLVLGILKMNSFTGTMDEMIVPLIVTVVVYILSLLIIFISARQVQTHPEISEMLKLQTSTFMMMGIAISSTFPLIAFTMIYIVG